MSKKMQFRLDRFLKKLLDDDIVTQNSFQQYLFKVDIMENIDAMCCTRTIRRDINFLLDKLDAPVRFDTESQTYVLYNKPWYKLTFVPLITL